MCYDRHMTKPQKPFIYTSQGLPFCFEEGVEEYPYSIHHIAMVLSRLCRFNGHTKRFYSVAEHSVFVSHLTHEDCALEGLLHDASEAFTGDITQPLKDTLPGLDTVGLNIQLAIYRHFGVVSNGGNEKSMEVHIADMQALATEKRDLLKNSGGKDWECLRGYAPTSYTISTDPVELEDVEYRFVERFNQLTK